jgi:hypothetical protein
VSAIPNPLLPFMNSSSLSESEMRLAYASGILTSAKRSAVFRMAPDLGHLEAYRLTRGEGGEVVIEHQSPLGAIYGALAVVENEAADGRIERPDFAVRGSTLCLMNYNTGGYDTEFSKKKAPWFFDRDLMTSTLDTFVAARLNTLFLWADHLFPYLLELPKYPEACELSPGELRSNYEQFLWLTTECQRRGIQVLLHFYNIHVSAPFAAAHGIEKAPTKPTPLLCDYLRYALTHYFAEFPNVGLYICPGETLKPEDQLEWFREVIFAAAIESGKRPLLVIRDWMMDMDFRGRLTELYDNVQSELKHNDESFTSPFPDVRHLDWENQATGHVVNAAHGPAMDLVPMRWACPTFIQEASANWKKLGFVTGVGFYGLSFWDWPHTLDKVESDGGMSPKPGSPRLLTLDRDALYYAAFGRYLWQSSRDPQVEQTFWDGWLASRFGSEEVGRLLTTWHTVTGPISPGMQNVTATIFGNFWPSVYLLNQWVDSILSSRKRIGEKPATLTIPTGKSGLTYYSQPVDAWTVERYECEFGPLDTSKPIETYPEFEKYKSRMGIPDLEHRISMPVMEYAARLNARQAVTEAMTPDRLCDLLVELSEEGLGLARRALNAGALPETRPELERFVSDSQMYVLSTKALRHKVLAAILKGRMLLDSDGALGTVEVLMKPFLEHMEASVVVYRELVDLTVTTYYRGDREPGAILHEQREMPFNGGPHWQETLPQFEEDLRRQQLWMQSVTKPALAQV